MPESQTRKSRLFTRALAARIRARHQPLRRRFSESKRPKPSVSPEIPDHLLIRGSGLEPHVDKGEPSQPPRSSSRIVGPDDRNRFSEIQSGVERNTTAIPEVYVESMLPIEEVLVRDFEVYAPDLTDALRELYDVQCEARSDGGVVPDDDAVERAKRILMDMYRISPRLYAVYPMDDGEIAIDAATKYGTSLVVLCNPDGSAQCLTYIGEEYRTKEYPDTGTLPDDFIRKALLDSTPTH